MSIGDRFPLVLSAAADGAEWAWAELYRDLSPGVLRFLTGQGATDPEDCLGEVFVQVVRQVGAFTGDEPAFRTWVYGIARSRLIDAWRREQRRPPIAGEDLGGIDERLPRGDAPDPEFLQRAAVDEILARLGPDQRTVLMLRYLHQFSVEQVADIIGKSAGAVRVIQHRALRTLRRTLPGHWDELQREGDNACA